MAPHTRRPFSFQPQLGTAAIGDSVLGEISYSAGLYRRPAALNPEDASTGPGAWNPGTDIAGVRGLTGLSAGGEDGGGGGGGLEGRPEKLRTYRGFRSAIVLEGVAPVRVAVCGRRAL